MDIHELRTHIDARLDRFESKQDRFEGKFDAFVAAQTTRNETDAKEDVRRDERIDALRGFAALIIMILLAVCGFLATGYFNRLGGS